jgi:putative nucleotidyltransferase with HDIG domain
MIDDHKTNSPRSGGGTEDRSVAGDDIFAPEPMSDIDHLRPVLVHGLFSAGRTLHIYDLNNRASQTVVARLLETLEKFHAADGHVTVTVATDLLLINDVRVVVDAQSMGSVLYVIDEMRKRNVEEIDFPAGCTAAELGTFLKLFFVEPEGEDVFGELSNRLTNAGVTNIKLTEWVERETYLREAKVERREIREESNRVMSRAVLFMGEVMRSIEQQRPIRLHKAHRLTQQMADIIKTDESILVGLASIKDYDEYTFSHSVNVSVLSMLIADRMGLNKSVAAQIGVAALLHDIGKTHIPQSILNKPASLTEEEWKWMERHTMLGVIELSRVRSLRAIVDAVFVSLQHHLEFGGGGYPQKPGNWQLHPFVHIVIVADVFDAMTTPRVYREQTLTPDRVLRFILHNSGKTFDPLVAKVFAKAMGVYPVGTVVDLDTGERAVVVRQNEDTRLMHRPVVVLLNEGGPHGDPVDLSERADGTGTYRRTITRSVHQRSYEASKASCFITK